MFEEFLRAVINSEIQRIKGVHHQENGVGRRADRGGKVNCRLFCGHSPGKRRIVN